MLKTSEEWTKDPQYSGLTVLDPDGWPRDPDLFDYAWGVVKISQQEFERMLMSSTIIWSLPKL